LDSISVPVNQPLTLYVIISQPAPQGGLYFELSSEDTDIVAAGDETQAFLPEVFIPEGETVSGPFEIFGIQTGSTNLDILPEDSDYSTSSTPTTAWSVNPDPDGDPQFTVFLDANASYNDCRSEDDPATLSSDPSVLSSCGGNVQGTVSDGVSQLLLRTVAGLAGTACYAISSTSDLDQGSISTAVAATQGGDDDDDFQYAFSFYQAPAEYGDTSQSRGVDVIFSFTPSLGNGNTSTISTCSGCDLPSLTIIRPPVLLIHGIWSSKLTWNQGNWFRSGSYYVTKTMNYQGTNASSFSVNFPAVQTAVKSGLDAVHDLGAGFAATQVDVVGHSMGGLLTRLYAESDNFERPDNFDEGDIRRLVTLDTPHFGASLANMVVSLTKNSVVFRALGDLLSGIRGLGFDVPVFNQGAVCDLAENSPALQDLADGTDLASQVITAQGGPQPPPTPRKFWAPLEFALTLRVPFYVFPQNVVNDFRFLSNNDTIVPISSQLGGLAFDSDDDFPPDIHTNVEHDSSVSAQAFDLLDGLSGDFSDSLPGVPSNGLGNPLTVPGRGMALDQSDYASECRPGGPLNPASDASSERLAGGSQPDNAGTTPALVSTASAPVGDPRVQIARPANNQQFAPGDTVNVTLQLTAPLTASAAFIAPEVAGLGPLLATGASGDSYKASFVIPNTFAGPLVIAPAILDSNQNPIRGVTTTIDVVPPGAPSGLILAGGNYTHLPSAPASDSIDVTGIYPDGVQLNLTSSVTGTTYASSNPDVLTVDANGNVNVLASGTASVAVENGSQKAFSTFVVENSAKPLPPQDVTARVRISESGFQLNRSTGFFVQTVQLSNSTSFPIVGPLYFVLSDLPSGVTLISNSGGKTQTIPPARTPFIRLKLADGFTLQPGANVSLTLQFLDQSRTRINYTPKVFRKLGTP
jgi:pimeloyl-ACP methyl ester carboxylesterase